MVPRARSTEALRGGAGWRETMTAEAHEYLAGCARASSLSGWERQMENAGMVARGAC